jgi:proline dehydrogenase
MVSFDNTEYAFASKSSRKLKKAHFLFSMMNRAWLVNFGLRITPNLIKWNIPFIKPLIRNTIFQQFVGGETLQRTTDVANKLGQYNVQVILDYGAEGNDGEEGFDKATQEFIRVIDYASAQKNIPFISVKVTAIARFALLEKIDIAMNAEDGTLIKRYLKTIGALSKKEKEELHNVRLRIMHICKTAHLKKVGVLIDAEESWIQGPVDALAILMMYIFNKQRAVVYNTIQLYRHDRLKFLKDSFEWAIERDFISGAKLVRGAYMEKERKRAIEMGYLSPIQPDKQACDRDYNAAIEFCFEHLHKISTIIASHNEDSNLLAVQLMQQNKLSFNHPNIHFSQLYGMSDNITFNLAKAGCLVSKYLPFGPIKEVIPYLMRRAQENSSVGGQTGRELGLIKKELKRRKNNHSNIDLK